MVLHVHVVYRGHFLSAELMHLLSVEGLDPSLKFAEEFFAFAVVIMPAKFAVAVVLPQVFPCSLWLNVI